MARKELYALLEVSSEKNADLIIDSFKTGTLVHVGDRMYIAGDKQEKKEYESQMKIYKEAKEREGLWNS